MKFLLAEEVANSTPDMYLSFGVNDDGDLCLLAYSTNDFTNEYELLVFRADGLHLKDSIDVVGWPVDKNGYIKIIRDKD